MRLVRWLRHELATPLSGAALHLELASQRLAAGERFDPERALENVRMSQAEVDGASGLLDVLSEVVKSGDETPGLFSLADAVVDGAAPAARNLRGISVEVPDRAPVPRLFGIRQTLERAVTDLTSRAVGRAAERGIVRWTVEAAPDEERLVLSWPGCPNGHVPGSIAGGGIAQWAVESHGGTLRERREDGRCVVAAVFSKETH